MSGAPVIASWIAQFIFWTVMVLAYVTDALRPRSAVAFLALWAIGCFGLPQLTSSAAVLATSYVALLDVALVLVVFGGDLRLS